MALWQKGQSGNPSGRPKIIKDIQELARQYTVPALQALVDIATSGESESARVAAATALLDRGYGKPVTKLEHGRPGEFDELNADQLRDFVRTEIAALGVGDSAAEIPGADGEIRGQLN